MQSKTTQLQKKIPELRFPGFEGEWEEKRLGEVADFCDEQRIPLEINERSNRNGEYPYYGASGVIDHINDYIFDGEYILLAEDGANIVTRSTRIAFLARGKFWVNNHAHVLRARGSNYFLSEFLESLNFERYNTGTTQPKLNAKVCKEIHVILPTETEQKKISNFLGTADEWIGNLKAQKQKWEEYKKGMMQKIFSREIRFKDKDGNEFPEWEEKGLGEVAKVDPSTSSLPPEFYYIDLESVDNGQLNGYIRLSKDNAPSRAQRVLEKGDILFQTVRPYQQNNLFFNLDGDFVASTGYAQIRAKQDSRFLYHYLHEHTFLRDVLARCTGSNYPAINSSDLKRIAIRFPSEDEQQKIASFLTAVDEMIHSHQQRIVQAEEWKKGLMQRMFV